MPVPPVFLPAFWLFLPDVTLYQALDPETLLKGSQYLHLGDGRAANYQPDQPVGKLRADNLGAFLAETKSTVYVDLGAKDLLSVLVGVSG